MIRQITDSQYVKAINFFIDSMNNPAYFLDRREMWKEACYLLKEIYTHRDDTKSAQFVKVWNRFHETRFELALEHVDKMIQDEINKGIIEQPEGFEYHETPVDVTQGGRGYERPKKEKDRER
jgi:hypothetical protein